MPKENTARDIDKRSNNKPSHIAYYTRPGNDRDFWMPCGAAWAHKDGKGFRLKLDAIPTGGIIELRVNEPLATNPDHEVNRWWAEDESEGA